jgi:small-conductance mechanosensitive channel
MRGISYLALLPYFLGALINKEGYWQWSRELHRLQGKKPSKIRTRVLQIMIALLLVGLISVAYLYWGSGAVRTLLLLILTAMWIGIVRRAWLAYKDNQRSYHLGHSSKR